MINEIRDSFARMLTKRHVCDNFTLINCYVLFAHILKTYARVIIDDYIDSDYFAITILDAIGSHVFLTYFLMLNWPFVNPDAKPKSDPNL